MVININSRYFVICYFECSFVGLCYVFRNAKRFIKFKSLNKISIDIFTEMRTTLVNAGCILCLVVAINFHPIVGNVEDEGISPPMNNAIQEYV